MIENGGASSFERRVERKNGGSSARRKGTVNSSKFEVGGHTRSRGNSLIADNHSKGEREKQLGTWDL